MNNTPYISVPELLAAATGINWDTIPKREATDQEKQAAYQALTVRGTSWVNTCAKQVLSATWDTDTLRVGTRRCGYRHGVLTVFTRFSPVIGVPLFGVGNDGVVYAPFSGDVLIDGSQSLTILNGTPTGGFIRITYLHGWANTALAADVTAGDSSLTVNHLDAIESGLELTIYDGGNTEQIQVGSNYISGATIPLVSPLLYDHPVGTLVSALPAAVREAAQLAALHYARERGRSAITVQPTGGARSIVAVNQLEEFKEASGLLRPFQRVL